MQQLQIKSLSHMSYLPKYHNGSVSLDICSCQNITIQAGKVKEIHTALKLFMPSGYIGVLTGLKSNAQKYGISLMLGVEYIDKNNTNELTVLLENKSEAHFDVHQGDIIAKLILLRAEQPRIVFRP